MSDTILDGEKFKKAVEESVKKAVENLKDETISSLTGGIIDVDKFTTYIKGGTLGTDLKDALIAGVKNSGLALTTTALDTLNEMLDLSITPEENNDNEKHVISTQAIAGAGGGDVGVAGSVAIAVLNGTTRASIENYTGNGQTNILDAAGNIVGRESSIEAGGEIDIIAVNDQKVTTTASGAIDADGDADKNEGAGESETKKAEGEANHLAVTVGDRHDFMSTTGGSVAKTEDNHVRLTAEEGYILPTKVSYTYTNNAGEKKSAEATVDAEGNLTIPEITGLDEKAKVTWNVVFSPELYDISKNSENAGNLTVKVKDRDTDRGLGKESGRKGTGSADLYLYGGW